MGIFRCVHLAERCGGERRLFEAREQGLGRRAEIGSDHAAHRDRSDRGQRVPQALERSGRARIEVRAQLPELGYAAAQLIGRARERVRFRGVRGGGFLGDVFVGE
jgi:hypothetical protein